MDEKIIIKAIQEKIFGMDMSECNWGEGVAMWGLKCSLDVCPDKRYISVLSDWVRHGIENDLFKYNVNSSMPCVGIGEVYSYTKAEGLLKILRKQADYLMYDAPRLKCGAIIHSDPYALFGRQMWADTVFMAGLFIAYFGKLTSDEKYCTEALNQLKIHMRILQDADGLCYHAFDETEDRLIGCKWGRANAWLAVAYMELLDYLAPDEELSGRVKALLGALSPYQSENGLFRTVIDGKMSYYEASSAYGFGYAILKGIRKGVLDDEYLKLVYAMKKILAENVNEDGVVMNISAGTPVMRNEYEYNIICQHRMQPWGQALAAMYFSEACRFEKFKKAVDGN